MHRTVTIKDLRRNLIDRFKAAGLDTPDLDVRILLCALSGLSAAELITYRNDTFGPELSRRIKSYANRRLCGEPMDSILGEKEFYGRMFKLSKDVLSPRPETETVIEHSLIALKDCAAPHILDLGTGSGSLLVTLLCEIPDATGVGVDISITALDMARRNGCTHAINTRCQWRQGSWLDAIEPAKEALKETPHNEKETFHLIVSNPPYITDMAMQTLPREVVEFDPDIALRGGVDGLEAYKTILKSAGEYLKPNGQIIFEIGYDQAQAVTHLMADAGYKDIKLYQDLSGHDRVIQARIAL